MNQLFVRLHQPIVWMAMAFIGVFLTSFLLFQHWYSLHLTRAMHQLSQNAALLSAQPLRQKQANSLQITLNALSQHSVLPVKGIVVFDQRHRIFSRVGPVDDWLEQAIQAMEQNQTEFQLDGMRGFSVPIWADGDRNNQNQVQAPAIRSEQLGFLIVLFEQDALPPLWLWGPGIFLWLFMGGLYRWQKLQFSQQQQFILQQLLASGSSNQTSSMFQPLILAWQQQQLQHHQALENLQNLTQNQQKQLGKTLQQLQEDVEDKNLALQQTADDLTQARLILGFWQRLGHESQQQNSACLSQDIATISLFHRTLEPEFVLQPQAIVLPNLLSTQLPLFQEVLADHQLIVDEDPEAFQYTLQLDASIFSHLLLQLVRVCGLFASEPDIVLSYRFHEGSSKVFSLVLKYSGPGLSPMWRRALSEHTAWSELPDLHASMTCQLLKLCQAQLKLHSLDDLGTQIEVRMQVNWQKNQQPRKFQSILLVDEKPCRLPLFRQSLLALAEQVGGINDFNQLAAQTNRRLLDCIVLILPEQAQADWRHISLLRELSQRFFTLAFAQPSQAQAWQSILQIEVNSLPLLLDTIAQAPVSAKIKSEKRLLVVDDNQTNLSYIKAVLASEDCKLDFAMTGQEAIQQARSNRYSLILMDIQLPDISGVEATRLIRQLDHHQQTEILAFTAHALPEEIASFRAAGMNEVLIKPLDAAKIAVILQKMQALPKIDYV